MECSTCRVTLPFRKVPLLEHLAFLISRYGMLNLDLPVCLLPPPWDYMFQGGVVIPTVLFKVPLMSSTEPGAE